MKPFPVAAVTVAVGVVITTIGILPSDPDPINITYVFSTDFDDLVIPLIDELNDEEISVDGRPIQVDWLPEPSGDSRKALAAGTLEADAWTPAASVWGNVLNATVDTEATVNVSADPLVLSPQVIAIWKPCARELGWTLQRQLAWETVLEAAKTRGEGTANCQNFALGGTYPDRSTSGLLALASWYQLVMDDRSLTVRELGTDSRASQIVKQIDYSIAKYFKTSSEAMDYICGDILPRIDAVYLQENTIVANNTRECLKELESEGMVAIYPTGGTYVADYPYYTVTRQGSTATTLRAVDAVGDWLSERITPELAGSFGFRTADGGVNAIVDEAHGAVPQLPAPPDTLLMPTGEVAIWLENQWSIDCGSGLCAIE